MPRKWLQLMKYGKYNSYLWQTMWNHAKNLMKMLKWPNSLFFAREISSAVIKTWKTRKTKMWITPIFQILYAIQGTTMSKLTSWGFRKCGTFWVYNFLKGSYWRWVTRTSKRIWTWGMSQKWSTFIRESWTGEDKWTGARWTTDPLFCSIVIWPRLCSQIF